MNLKILFLLLAYYSILSSIFLLGGSAFSEATGYNNTIVLNDSNIASSEIDTGGLFGSGISFTRFAGFIGIGVGLPDDVPSWFNTLFILWQSLVLVFTLGFVISSIWDG